MPIPGRPAAGDMEKMNLLASLLNPTIRRVTRILCRVDDAQLARVPQKGPLILAANHVNNLDVPLMYTHLQPRPIAGFAKAEAWRNPIFALLFSVWRPIPLKRGEADVDALRGALDALQAGKILGLAPEGTRSHDGRLQRGQPGVVLLALRSGAPLLPVAYYGGERLAANLRRLRRTDFHIRVGRPFSLDPGGARVTHEMRQQMVDEIMYQIAALLPPAYRGYYSGPPTTAYLRFAG